ncbi:MAG TPA: signal peptidase II [Actinomycetes bacterium]|nr:signal peptidase II [Actinomycetes bacterium]
MQATRGTSLSQQLPPPVGEAGSDGPHGMGTRSTRLVVLLFSVAALVLLLDQVSKALVVAHMPGRTPIELVGEWLRITYTRNPGAAFSVGGGWTALLSVIAIGVVVVIIRISSRLASLPWAIALGGILGGALGNLSDRMFRSPGPFRGYVVDWLQLPNWPVFNIADASIVCSALLMVLLSLLGISWDGSRPSSQRQPSE